MKPAPSIGGQRTKSGTSIKMHYKISNAVNCLFMKKELLSALASADLLVLTCIHLCLQGRTV